MTLITIKKQGLIWMVILYVSLNRLKSKTYNVLKIDYGSEMFKEI